MTPPPTATEQQSDSARNAEVRDIFVARPGNIVWFIVLFAIFYAAYRVLVSTLIPPGAPPWLDLFVMIAALLLVGLTTGGITAARATCRVHGVTTRAKGRLRLVERLLFRELRHRTYFSGMANIGALLKRTPLEIVVHKLAAAGAVGTTYRIVDDMFPSRALPRPLDVPFDPTPLSRRSAVFCELAGKERITTSLVRNEVYMAFGAPELSGARRWVFRVSLAAMALCALAWIIKAVVDLLHARVPDVITTLGPWIAPLVVVMLWCLWCPRRWTLVPGAIIVSTSGWRSAKWQPYMFRRSDSALLYWRRLNQLVVARTDGTAFSRRVSPEEADLALRAWRSPLPPPSIERMTDLV